MKVARVIGGLRDIKSMGLSYKRSIPRAASSAYLKLYMMQKEKDRLDNEVVLLDRRRLGIYKKLVYIQQQMQELEVLAHGEATGPVNMAVTEIQKPSEDKKWRKMPLNY
ncbi:MAG: hypothetical protein HYR55_10910 [Acidobacteria bacterium]|nr:hypothetical protein [Acidobacteriota bacterium]MBI3654841.1 hypothetical protein [Acidobacteriota bacterium]